MWIIGKLNFLEKSSQPDLAAAVHQAARFSGDPKTTHTSTMYVISECSKGIAVKGLILDPVDHCSRRTRDTRLAFDNAVCQYSD
jgi:hypothetical protein